MNKSKIGNIVARTLICVAIALAATACSKTQSYSELLRNEEHATNWYLAQKNVVMEIPQDSVFLSVEEYGENAPFYRIDPDGYVYMQVVKPGNKDLPDAMAKNNEQIFFRYTRWNIMTMYEGGDPTPIGNAVDMTMAATSFRYANLGVESSYKYGAAIQMPLAFLPIDCEVNLVMRSYYGFQGETTLCQPFLVNVRYYRPAMQ